MSIEISPPGVLEKFKELSLEQMEQIFPFETQPGYPTERFFSDQPVVDIPDGPWQTQQLDMPTAEETQAFMRMGLRVDSIGRPLHPWLDQMVTNRNIGVVAGKGSYWNWGGLSTDPDNNKRGNETADPIIIRHDLAEPHILLIRRGDNNQLALPGGFHDPGESLENAAAREADEEAFVPVGDRAKVQRVYDGPVADLRITAHAWPHTHATRFDMQKSQSRNLPIGPYKGGDDAKEAMWLTIPQVNQHLRGSHLILVRMALEMYG